ncbi:7037_t:CDS:2, partial [Acaulospora morrowiae]
MIEKEVQICKVGPQEGRKYLPNEDGNNDTPSPIGNMRTPSNESGSEKQEGLTTMSLKESQPDDANSAYLPLKPLDKDTDCRVTKDIVHYKETEEEE